MQRKLSTYYGLLERYRYLIVVICSKYAHGRAELCHELVQEATLKLWKNLDNLRPDASEGEQVEWVKKCTRSAALNYQRHKRLKTVSLEHIGDLAADNSDIEAAAAIDELFAYLEPGERKLVESHLSGIGNSELASKMGITPNAVAVRLFRVIKKMRKIYENITSNGIH